MGATILIVSLFILVGLLGLAIVRLIKEMNILVRQLDNLYFSNTTLAADKERLQKKADLYRDNNIHLRKELDEAYKAIEKFKASTENHGKGVLRYVFDRYTAGEEVTQQDIDRFWNEYYSNLFEVKTVS